jgi:putative ABC transport system permease protein
VALGGQCDVACDPRAGAAALLFVISRLDPIAYGEVLALLIVVSAVACSVPAWRASRVDPARTLRAE